MQRDPKVPPHVGKDGQEDVGPQGQAHADLGIDTGPDGRKEEDKDLQSPK